jgi:hypothetical protein
MALCDIVEDERRRRRRKYAALHEPFARQITSPGTGAEVGG